MIKVPTGFCAVSYWNLEVHFAHANKDEKCVLQKEKEKEFWSEAYSRNVQAKWERKSGNRCPEQREQEYQA